ncbi:hypothetical protein [Mycolicibacterium sp. J2]|uniref:hypothetical protein n=1 Tax=Mycolicibacterium sp. J2 TaxID=2993511 RepID=UPI00224AEA23|nr:hypothetical protein [Mycolicibacterium sp. J2]MCX2715646.1 hypothetical protein [Mycolicibacterium sp. J2]
MIEIRTGTEALTESQRLLEAAAYDAGATDFWYFFSVVPLAAVLLATAHDNAGFADLTAARDVLAEPAPELSGAHPGWLSVAQRCPDSSLSSALCSAAALEPRQRDSFCLSALDALAHA